MPIFPLTHLENHMLTFVFYLLKQGTELEYSEKLISLDTEKMSIMNNVYKKLIEHLILADSHLQQEIEKIKLSLEQEYNRRYERDQKQHQHDLYQLRQQLTNETDKQSIIYFTNQSIK